MIVNADVNAAAAIDATKIGTGVVSNAEFGYLDGVTSGIQGQLNGKSNLTTTPQQTTADITYYVRTDGNDGNTGLGNSAGGAFKTISKAISMVPQTVNHTVSVNVAVGTYAEDVLMSGKQGGGYVNITGTSAIVQSITLERCLRVLVTGFTATSMTKTAFFAYDGGTVDFKSCVSTVAAATDGIAFYNQKGMIENCTISNHEIAIHTDRAQVTINSCNGVNNVTSILPASSSVVTYGGAIPSGIVHNSFGGIVNPWGDNTNALRPSGELSRGNNTTTQSFTANAWQKLLFTTNFANQKGIVDLTNSRFVVPESGTYMVCIRFALTFSASSFNERILGGIFIDGNFNALIAAGHVLAGTPGGHATGAAQLYLGAEQLSPSMYSHQFHAL